MNRFWTILFDMRVLSVIGIAGLVAFLFFGATALEVGLIYAGTPGVRISATTNDGRSIDIFNEPGRYGLERLFAEAKKTKTADGGNELTWTKDGHSVSMQLRIISQPGATAQSSGEGQARGASGLLGLGLPALVAGGANSASPTPVSTNPGK